MRPAVKLTGGGCTGFVQQAEQEALTVTFFLDNPEDSTAAPSIRVLGQRLQVDGPLADGDRLARDVAVNGIVPGSGPVSVTVRVFGVNPGAWQVTAETLQPELGGPRRVSIKGATRRRIPVRRAAWSWRRWALLPAVPSPVHTCLGPLASVTRMPAVLPFVWGPVAAIGIVVALILEGMLVARGGGAVRAVLLISVLAVLAGIAGAKIWYIVLQRKQHSMNGWCIQGLLVGVTAVVGLGVVLDRLPLGVVLDALTPGLLVGMAIGRVGCFFAGCCAGRPTASRWGIWSSDRQVGARRIPTQLLEAALCALVGGGALMLTLRHQPGGNGALFAASLAAYTLVRQGILRLRVEKRRSLIGGPLTAAIAAATLIASTVALVVTG